jgi:hypothetical protein
MCPLNSFYCSTAARRAERFATASSSAPAGDNPRPSRAPGQPASADGGELLADTHRPTRATLVRQPDRWHKQASAPEPLVGPRLTLDRPGGHLEDLAMACRTCRESVWALLPPGCGRRHSPGHRLRRPVPLRTPGSGWPGDGHGRPLERPVGRTPAVQCDRPADGSGPGPDGGGQAVDTSAPSVRPCAWPAGHGQPRGLHVLALTGPDRTAMPMLPSATPAATSIGTRPS